MKPIDIPLAALSIRYKCDETISQALVEMIVERHVDRGLKTVTELAEATATSLCLDAKAVAEAIRETIFTG